MISKIARFYQVILPKARRDILSDVGLLIGRVGFAGMIMTHGYNKLTNFGTIVEKWQDPIGVGNELSLALAVWAEFFCALLVIIGVGTRLFLTQLIFTMGVAAFVVHGADPFNVKEMALVYLTGFVLLFLTGPGRFSVDHLIRKKFVGEK